MKATAIYVKSESGDNYLFCEPTEFTTETMVEFLKESLGGEAGYVGDLEIRTTGYDDKIDESAVYSALEELE